MSSRQFSLQKVKITFKKNIYDRFLQSTASCDEECLFACVPFNHYQNLSPAW